MKRETLVIRPEKHKRRIGVLPTYAQRDRTKYNRKAKHRGQVDERQDGSAGALDQSVFPNVFSRASIQEAHLER
ncbi:MAG: hypothetical protein ACYCS8_10445 [Acidithiobacillus sp.]